MITKTNPNLTLLFLGLITNAEVASGGYLLAIHLQISQLECAGKHYVFAFVVYSYDKSMQS